jgi:hypothetical protein
VSRRAISVAVAAAFLLVPLAGCGDDGDDAAADGELRVSIEDFHYSGLPESVPAGTEIVATNTSTVELHEFVAVRLDDADERSVDEIVAGDLGAVFAEPPATVILVPPAVGGEPADPIVAVGDGTLQEPGRYLVICAIPTGADPAEYLAAAATSDGPPEVAGGPPHFTQGMYAELDVVS